MGPKKLPYMAKKRSRDGDLAKRQHACLPPYPLFHYVGWLVGSLFVSGRGRGEEGDIRLRAASAPPRRAHSKTFNNFFPRPAVEEEEEEAVLKASSEDRGGLTRGLFGGLRG